MRAPRWWWWRALAGPFAGVALLVLACGGSTGSSPAATGGALASAVPEEHLVLTARDVAYDQKDLAASAGKVIEITLKNNGALQHDFSIERLPAEVSAAGARGAGTFDVHLAVNAKQQARVLLRVSTPGRYTYFCSVPGHRAAGMEGTLTIR